MRRLSALLAVTLAATTLVACAGPPEEVDDEFADLDIGSSEKADTVSAPTMMGALVRNLPATHSLVAVTSGYHLYSFDGTAGERLHLTLDSNAFRTYLRITSPTGARTSVSGVAHGSGWRSAIDPWVLPATGHYLVLATAYNNMVSFPSAKAHGSYTLRLETDPPPLTVSKVGSGTVTSTPAGINCGSACTASYPVGTLVTLTAMPGIGYHLVAWTGACTGTWTTCTVTMTAARSVTATFALNTFVLVTSTVGSGAIAVTPPGTSCGTGCYSYPAGTAVTLTATPAAGAHFIGWSGDCVGAGITCTVTVNAARTATATFAVNTYVLSVTASGGGVVTTNPTGSVYPYGAAVTLTATPAVGSHFAAWGGDCAGSAAICTVVMTQNRTVTAFFAVNTYVVHVSKVGSSAETGVITGGVNCPSGVTSCSGTFPYGTVVTLTAVNTQLGINAEWFQAWGAGPCAGSVNRTCTFTVTNNLTVSAQFQFVIGLLERVARQLPV